MTTSASSGDWWTAGGNGCWTNSYGPYSTPYTTPQPIYQPQPPAIFPGTDNNLHIQTGRAVCMAMGHQAVETAWEESGIVAYCSQCGEKFFIGQAPGGSTLMRVKLLLEILMMLEEQPVGVVITPTNDPLSELLVLAETLEEDFSALEEAEKLLGIAREIIKKRVESGVSYGPTLPGPESTSLY